MLQAQQAPNGGNAIAAKPDRRIKPNGEIETEYEYEARMAHNCYMRFSRSLRRTLTAFQAFHVKTS